MQKQDIQFAKFVVAAIVVVTGVAAIQMMTIQSVTAQQGPVSNQGQCQKHYERELGTTKEEAKQICSGGFTNTGQCIQAGIDKTACRDFFPDRI